MNPKIENVLQAGLEATPYEKTKSEELGEGYDEVNDKWELIINLDYSQRCRESS